MTEINTVGYELETLLNAFDPFVKSEDLGVEENGYEDDMEMLRRQG